MIDTGTVIALPSVFWDLVTNMLGTGDPNYLS